MKMLSSKIAAVMLVLGALGLWHSMSASVTESFKAYQLQREPSWQDHLVGYASLFLFFGGALLYIVDWMRAKKRKP